MSGPPPYPVTAPYGPYYLPPPPPPTPPRVRHSAGGWAAVSLSALVIVLSAWVGISVALGAGRPVPSFHAADELEAAPATDASTEDWNRWARRAVDVTVGAQGQALVDGNEDGYLAAVDPGRARLRDKLEHRYDVLHQMGVGQWEQSVRGRPEVSGELAWHAEVDLSYCFGDASCRPSTLTYDTDWEYVDGRLVLTDVADTTAKQGGPRPWESSDVVVATGKRTIVVASANLRRRLDETLDEAEAAAAVADTLAGPHGPPSRYVLYLADAPMLTSVEDLTNCDGLPATDWTVWFGPKPCWSGGVYLDDTDNEVIVNAAQDLIQDTVTHEFTHAATLGGSSHSNGDAVWWLVEGIAEYAMMIGRPVEDYGLDDLRHYIHDTWHGCPDSPQAIVCPPPYTADDPVEVSGPYGVAFLAVRYLADGYSQDAMHDFFNAVVLNRRVVDAASQAAFGKPWSQVQGEAEAYIRYA